MRRAVGLLALALVAGACSVTTPRHETALVNANRVGASAAARDSGSGPVGDAGTAAASETPGGASSASTASGAATGLSHAATGAATGSSGAAGSKSGAAAATNAGAVPGVTKDSITISIVAGFTGPLAALVNKAYEALQTWQDDVNAAGGIYGRKIVLKKVDHKETADGGVAACKEVTSNGSFFAAVPEGTDANVTAVNCLDAAGVPTVYYAAAADPKWKLAFADTLTSAQGGTILASYVKNGLHGAGKKVGAIYVNQSAYKAAVDTFTAESKRQGMTVADVEAVEPNQASFTSQLLRMQQAGVQILMISSTTETIGILRDARSMGWSPTFTGWGFQFDFLTEAGRSLFDGVTGLRTYATVDSPAYADYARHMDARGRNRDDRSADLEGFPTYGRALLYGEILKRAGANPTRQSFVLGAETIKGFDTGIIPPVTYGAGPPAHVGITEGFAALCCNSDYTWKSTGPPRSSW
jgi:branched-chain amino acid transport system substrate-binding protein